MLFANPQLSLHRYLKNSLYPANAIGHRAFYRLSIRLGRPQLDWEPISMVRFLRSFSSPSSLLLPAFYVYRHLGAAVFELNFLLEAFLSLGAVVSSPAFYVHRTSSAVWVPLFFRYSAFSLCYYFLHLFRFASMALPPVIVRVRLEIWKEVVVSFVASLLFRSPVHASRYKPYTFFRPGFEGFLPSPPRLAPIFGWLSSYIVRFYYLFPF